MAPTNRHACTIAAIILTAALAPARTAWATDIDWNVIYPASDADLGPVKFTGLILGPEFGFEELNFNGAGGKQLKTADGLRIGGEVGYDWQINGLVIGGITDLFWTGIDGRQAAGQVNDLRSNLNYYGTVRGRAGYAFGRALVYGTGGLAYSEIEIENRTLGVKDTQTLTGWTAGGGIEYVYNQKITLRAEYNRVDFGSASFSSLPAGSRDVGATFDLIKIGTIMRW